VLANSAHFCCIVFIKIFVHLENSLYFNEGLISKTTILYFFCRRILLLKERLKANPNCSLEVPDFNPHWNTVTSGKVKDKVTEVDRCSWICVDNKPLRYTLDQTGIPLLVHVLFLSC